MNKLKQLQEKLARERAQLKKIFEQAGEDMDMSKVSEISGSESEKLAYIRKANEGMTELGKQIDDMRALLKVKEESEREEKAAVESRRPDMVHPERRDDREIKGYELDEIGTAFVKAKAHLKENRGKTFELPKSINMKTLFQTSAGWAPQSLRTGLVVPFPVRPIQVIDLLPTGQTTMAAVKYMEETTLTDVAAETSEGGAYPEAAMALTEKSVIVDKVAAYLPMTDEQLADVAQAESYINNRLPAMLRRRVDSQLILGNGSAPNLQGITTLAGTRAQAATAGDGIADTIYRAIVDILINGRANADAIVMHPNDWLSERLRKTAQGAYVWGSPQEIGPERMWGLPIAKSDILTAGTAVVGDFREYSQLVERQGIEVETGYVNDDFIKGRQAVRADWRLAALWLRPKAFSIVTLPAVA